MIPQESSRLFQRARQGSSEAVGRLFERYGARLHALIRLRLGPHLRRRLESRDILQATLLKAFQGFDRFDGSKSASLMAWMGRIAHDEICDQADFYVRQKRNAAREVSLDERIDPLEKQLHTEVSRLQLQRDSERLEQAMDALSEPYREVILLRYYEELPFRDIGELLGKSPDACRMLLARAMTALTLKMREMA